LRKGRDPTAVMIELIVKGSITHSGEREGNLVRIQKKGSLPVKRGGVMKPQGTEGE